MGSKNWEIVEGSVFTARHNGELIRATAVRVGTKLRYQVDGYNEPFRSLSGAAKEILGRDATGASFWVPGTEPRELKRRGRPRRVPVEGEEQQQKTKRRVTSRMVQVFYKARNQENTPEGQTRWYCTACANSSYHSTGDSPEVCPNGHGNYQEAVEESPALV